MVSDKIIIGILVAVASCLSIYVYVLSHTSDGYKQQMEAYRERESELLLRVDSLRTLQGSALLRIDSLKASLKTDTVYRNIIIKHETKVAAIKSLPPIGQVGLLREWLSDVDSL
jgi:hypothetical protein